ncbi:MAG: M48 family metalloprotease [Ignavibacteria bacterium]|nr:M48 family metalloprotease [Ignavibacteria bacterium]
MKNLIIIIFVFLFSFHLKAQDIDKYISSDHWKYQITEKIYNILCLRTSTTNPPELFIVNKSYFSGYTFVAGYDRDNNSIILNELVFDICYVIDSINNNALAYVLAHELAHYKNNHGWSGDFIKSFNDTTSVRQEFKSIPDLAQRVKDESEADYYGAWYCYMSGFDISKIAVATIEKIYSVFNENNVDMKGYPSKDERINIIVQKTVDDLQEYIPVFEVGNRLMVTGNYSTAYECFNYIISKGRFESSEIYNNLGVAKLLQSLEIDTTEKFIFPVEFDIHTKLHIRRGGNVNDIKRFLDNAEKNFSNALERDPEYLSAKINLICVNLIRDRSIDYEKANNILDEIEYEYNNFENVSNFPEVDLYSKWLILKGILFYKVDNIEEARKHFEYAKELQPDNIAIIKNLKILNNENLETSNTEENLSKEEDIAGLKPIEFKLNHYKNSEIKEKKFGREGSKIKIYSINNSDNLILYIETQNKDVKKGYFIITRKNYLGSTSKGIELNDSEEQLKTSYYLPGKIYNTMLGEYWVYERSKIAFYIDKNTSKINEWMIYYILNREEKL